jgi:hypothetical protein
VRLEGLGQLQKKNPRTSLGIEPAIFRPLAQRFKELRYRMPPLLLLLLYTGRNKSISKIIACVQETAVQFPAWT